MCLRPIDVGVEAEWNAHRRTVTCLSCADDVHATVRSGVAGASAQREADRLRLRQAERHRAITARQPILGRLKLAVANEPVAGRSWSTGAKGEAVYGAALDRLRSRGLLVLHDRRLPRSKANIDHLAVTSAGVWVIDSKRYKGVVTKVDKGGWFRTDLRLVVGGRDRTALIQGVHRQVAHVQDALRDWPGQSIAVRGALCFVEAELRLFAKPFTIGGVLVSWPKPLRERLVAPGSVSADERAALHQHLARSFPPAA